MMSILMPAYFGARVAIALLSGAELFQRAKEYLSALLLPGAGLVFVYVIVVVWYAGVYGWVHHASPPGVTIFAGRPTNSPIWEYLFFSFMVMATMGGFTRLYPATGFGEMIIVSQVLINLVLTAVAFAGVLAYVQPIFARLTDRRRFVPLVIGERFFVVEPAGLQSAVSVVTIHGCRAEFELMQNEPVFGAKLEVQRTPEGCIARDRVTGTVVYDVRLGPEIRVRFQRGNAERLAVIVDEDRVRLQDARNQQELAAIRRRDLGPGRAAIGLDLNGHISDRVTLPPLLRDSLMRTC